jgi:hypothetical protein
MKFAVAFFALTGLVATQDTHAQYAKPSDAIRQAYAAVNNKDTAAYLATLSQHAREIYRAEPKRLTADLEYWKTNHFDFKIVSEDVDDSVGYVTYRVKVTGANPERVAPSVIVAKEGDSWHIVEPSFYSAYERIPSLPVGNGKSGDGC